jgi:Protein kinase domain
VSTHTEVEIGAEFLGYRIESVIGQGGMGVVYRAYDLRLKRMVALKLMAPELALDERFRARFTRETELAMSLEHPNVVPIYDAGEVDGHLYLAMRHVEGADLRALLRAEGSLNPARALGICGQVAAALDAAHTKRLVHRDVKPSNVLLDEGEHVYLADFGLTRRLEEEGATPGEGRSLGTPAYLAPEQIEGGPIDGRADVYSLGCVLFQCLTGEVPFAADSQLAVAWAHLEEEPPRASLENPDLSEAIDPVLYKAMAKEPERRHPSCTALIADAEAALGLRQLPILRPARLLLLAAVAILVALAAALAVTLIIRSDVKTAASVPPVRENTIVRIDPAKNAITDVINVGMSPSATAVGGQSVWVYNHYEHTVTEIDAATTEVRQTAAVSARPRDLGLLTGPILEADAEGAWLVGVDDLGRSFLTRLLTSGRGKREHPLDIEPKAVALGEGALWVLGHGRQGDQVLRVEPDTGEARARTRFPAFARVDSLAVGLGSVWAGDSSTATLYRIDPRSSMLTGQRDFGERAARPVVRSSHVWVPVLDHDVLVVDPRTLDIVNRVCCPEMRGPGVAGYRSTWLADVPSGEVVRFSSSTAQVVATIPVVTGSPLWGHPCLSSIAAGAGGVWVTVAPSVADTNSGIGNTC